MLACPKSLKLQVTGKRPSCVDLSLTTSHFAICHFCWKTLLTTCSEVVLSYPAIDMNRNRLASRTCMHTLLLTNFFDVLVGRPVFSLDKGADCLPFCLFDCQKGSESCLQSSGIEYYTFSSFLSTSVCWAPEACIAKLIKVAVYFEPKMRWKIMAVSIFSMYYSDRLLESYIVD